MTKILAQGNWDISNIETYIKGEYHPNQTLKKLIQDSWHDYLTKFPDAFDGSLGRLKTWETRNNKLKLSLESTNFSSYIATRGPKFSKEFPNFLRADPLGITIIVITSDRKIIVGKRPPLADQNPDKLYFIGGYLNPQTQKNSGNALKQSILNEIKEELNIDKKCVKKITAHCLAYNPIYQHPEIFVKVELNLESDLVKKGWKFAKDSKEMDKIFFIKKEFLLNQYKSNNLPYKTTWGFNVGVGCLTTKLDFVAARYKINL